MGYNVPSYDTTRFSFGPGILYLGAQGSTPAVDIGAVKGGGELVVERTKLEVKQGSPQALIQQYVIEEIVQFKISGIEWNFDNLSYALGAGVTAGIGGVSESLDFGGDMAMSNRALRFVHRTPNGSTLDLHIFAAQGEGKVSVKWNENDMHEFPFQFNALIGTTDFTGVALADKKKLFKIIKTKV